MRKLILQKKFKRRYSFYASDQLFSIIEEWILDIYISLLSSQYIELRNYSVYKHAMLYSWEATFSRQHDYT